MTGNPVAGKSGTYLLVLDLPEMMEAYERVGLQVPDVAFFKERQRCLAAKIQEIVPDCCVETVEASKFNNSIVALLNRLLTNSPEMVVISTVSDVAAKTNGHCIQVNRMVDSRGNSIGVGPRPGHNSLHSQFDEIKGRLETHSVVLVEDGSFSGGTMTTMIKICNKMQIEIKHVVAGFLFPAAKKAIMEVFPREEDIHCLRDESLMEWMPDHDFFPFVPNSGRVIGFAYDTDRNMPVYLHNGLSLCQPYVLPYGNPVGWASIPAEHAKKFSIFCFRQARDIFHEMERINGRKITLEALHGTYPHVSLPVDIVDVEFPHIKTRILDTLLYHENANAFSS